MKSLLFAVIVSGACVLGQTPDYQYSHEQMGLTRARPKTPRENAQAVVENLLRGGFTPGGVGTSQLHRMGDDASVQLIRIFGSRPLTETELTTSLFIMRAAFEYPEAIYSPPNKRTVVTSFFLEHLLAITQSEELRGKIDEALQYVTKQVPSPPSADAVGVDSHWTATIKAQLQVGVPVTGAPFSAEIIVQDQPLLTDGALGTPTYRRGRVYRNIDGMTRVDMFEPVAGRDAGVSRFGMIFDPRTRIGHILEFQNQVDHVIGLQATLSAITGCCPEKMTDLQSTVFFLFAAAGRTMPSLGMGWRGDSVSVDRVESIDGQAVEGYGEQLTSPEGTRIVVKTWYAPELKQVVIVEVSDARYGESKIGLIDIKQVEPEASLFLVPARYRAVEEKIAFKMEDNDGRCQPNCFRHSF